MSRLKRSRSKRTRRSRRILAVLILVALLWPGYILAGRTLCHIALRQIAELTNTKIETESVSFHTNGSVLIKKLAIKPLKPQDSDDSILEANAVYVRFSLGSLLLLNPRLKGIDVRDFMFNAQYDLDTDRWNLSALKIGSPKGKPTRMPRVRLYSGILQYTKTSNGEVEVAVSVPLDAEFKPAERAQKGYAFEIITADMVSGLGQTCLAGFWKPGSVTITGGISSVDVAEFEMEWIVDAVAGELTYDKDGAFSLKLMAKDLLSIRKPAPDKLALVKSVSSKSNPFAALQSFFDRYQPSGRIDVDLDMSGDIDHLGESILTGTVQCKDVSICYYKFKYAIEKLAGRIDFTRSSATLNNLSGRHGDVRLFFNGSTNGFGEDWKYLIRITSDNMPLDNDLYEALSPRQQDFWAAFSPAGSAAIDYRFTRISPTDKRKKLTVEPRGAEAEYCSFPYPLKNLTGKLSFERNKVVFSDVVSQVDNRKITLNGEVVTSGTDDKTYDLAIKAENVPLDAVLESALPKKQKDLFERFDPSGLASGWINVSATDKVPQSVTADLSFENASFKSDRLALPVSDISARAVFSPDLIVVKEFSGRYRDSTVSLKGQIQPNEEPGQTLYNMSVTLENTEPSSELLDLLPKSAREIVAEWKPEGRVNFVTDVSRDKSAKSPDYAVSVECLGNSVSFPMLAHRLRDVTGTITVDGDTIQLKDVSAALDYEPPERDTEATVEVNGQVKLTGGVFDSALLQVSASDILFDKQLHSTLPQRARGLYDDLAEPGRFDLDFEKIQIETSDNGRRSVDFTGDVTLKNCGFKVSGSRIELNSVLKTEGRYRIGRGFSSCRAALDSGTLKIWGKTLRTVNSDIFYDPNQALWFTEDLVADFYGGKLKGRFELQQLPEQAGQYVLQTGFDNVDLKRFLAETKLEEPSENGHTSGQMDGELNISARLGDSSTRIGTCKFVVRDMQVGKLSPLAKLINVFQLTAPQDFAFDQMLVDSYVKGNDLAVRKLDLAGEAYAFSGSGLLDLQNLNVNLKLTARGRRLATDDPSVLQSLTEGLGQAVVRMDVVGSLHEPKVTTETLPVIRETLQVFGKRPATSN